MILYISSFIIFLFVSFNLFFRVDCPVWLKLCGSALILLISLKYVVYRVIGGAFFSPDLPESFILVCEALYGALIILFFLLILLDIYMAGNWVLSRAGMPIPKKLPYGAIKCGLAAFALGLGCWGTWQSVKVPDVRMVEIRLEKLPAELDGFKIAQLSDLHIGPLLKRDWLSEVVAKTNALEPDLIALTGDYVDGYVDDIAVELRPLANLKAKYGVYGVTGNHEYYWNATAWTREISRLGVDMLFNERRVIDVNGRKLVVAGLPDLAAQRFGFPAPDIKTALAGAPDAVRLLLSHQPKNLQAYMKEADLQLSGHTHGGVMFFLRPLVAKFNEGFVVGQYDVSGKKLYVNPGTGLWNGFSCRIGDPSEITLIVLRGGG